jgi:tetratricopeptide (TPR) repeat protein
MQRGESLMGLFYLLTLYCFIRGTESPGAGLWFTLSIAACLLGMGTKEVMVTAPLMVLLYDRTFVAGSFRAAWTQRWRLYLGLGGTWLLLGYLMTGLQYRKVGYGLGITWQTYAFTECRVVVKYLWLALWPHPLVFDYGMEIIIRHAAEAVPYALILLLLIGGVVIALKRWPAIGFIGAWFFVLLAPSSSVVPVAAQPMAESRLYLPLAAVVVSAVIGIYAWLGRRSLVVFLVVAVGLGFLTAQRNADYSSDVSIWSDTLMKRPQNPRAHNNLGKALLEAGKVQEAIGQLKQALQIADLAEAHNNLGNALAQTGKIEEAIPHYERALQIWPNYFIAHNNLGNALVQVGRTQDAIKHYEQALRIRPDYAKAQNSLAWILATDGEGRFRNPVEAVRLAERACDLTARRDPNFLDTLAAAYAAQSRFTDAVRTAQEALKLAAVTGPNRLTNEIQTRLELYKAGHPYYEKPAASEPAQ